MKVGIIIIGIILLHFICGAICVYYFLGSQYVPRQLNIFEIISLVIFGPIFVIFYLCLKGIYHIQEGFKYLKSKNNERKSKI